MAKRDARMERLLDILQAQAGEFQIGKSDWETGYRSGLIKAMRLIEDNWND